jgi:hypothetical protein
MDGMDGMDGMDDNRSDVQSPAVFHIELFSSDL